MRKIYDKAGHPPPRPTADLYPAAQVAACSILIRSLLGEPVPSATLEGAGTDAATIRMRAEASQYPEAALNHAVETLVVGRNVESTVKKLATRIIADGELTGADAGNIIGASLGQALSKARLMAKNLVRQHQRRR
jgi:hypothetical protein